MIRYNDKSSTNEIAKYIEIINRRYKEHASTLDTGYNIYRLSVEVDTIGNDGVSNYSLNRKLVCVYSPLRCISHIIAYNKGIHFITEMIHKILSTANEKLTSIKIIFMDRNGKVLTTYVANSIDEFNENLAFKFTNFLIL